ncbi:MAG TPA: isochorismatase family protein [Nocardioidaceae bacterium]|nr:isochorismatase family protein [Nocardioidaceae bacterium]
MVLRDTTTTDTVPADSGWLVVVDMQAIFADPDSPWATPGFEQIVAPVQRLVDAAGDRVAYTRFVAPEVASGAWRRYYEQWPFALQPPTAPAYQIVDALAPRDRPVVSLPTFGKWGADLDSATHGSGDVVVVGVSTDCCVLSTALGAADAGVRVRVVGDACRGLSDGDHQRALDAMALYAPLIEITDTATVLAAFDG